MHSGEVARRDRVHRGLELSAKSASARAISPSRVPRAAKTSVVATPSVRSGRRAPPTATRSRVPGEACRTPRVRGTPVAAAVVGLASFDPDRDGLRIESILRDGIAPRIVAIRVQPATQVQEPSNLSAGQRAES